MTTVTPARPDNLRTLATKFGYCNTGNHEICPGRIKAPIAVKVMKGGQLVKVMKPGMFECGCTACFCKQMVKCLDCRHTSPEDVSPETWSCLDRDACLARQEAARDAHPFLVRLKEIRAMTAQTEDKPKREAKPKIGNCLCCGEETKGGKFLPGHDARFVSEQVAFVLQGTKTEAQAREALAETSDSLKGKFEKSLGLAREKAARKAEAEAKSKEEAAAEVGADEVKKASKASKGKQTAPAAE